MKSRVLPAIEVIGDNHVYINGYLVDMVKMRHELGQNQLAGHQEWQDMCVLEHYVRSFSEKSIDSTLIWWLQQSLAIATGRRRRLFYIPDEPFIISCNDPFSRVGDGRVMSTRWAIKSEPSHRQISTHWYDLKDGQMTGEWPEQRYRERAEQVKARLKERAKNSKHT